MKFFSVIYFYNLAIFKLTNYELHYCRFLKNLLGRISEHKGKRVCKMSGIVSLSKQVSLLFEIILWFYNINSRIRTRDQQGPRIARPTFIRPEATVLTYYNAMLDRRAFIIPYLAKSDGSIVPLRRRTWRIAQCRRPVSRAISSIHLSLFLSLYLFHDFFLLFSLFISQFFLHLELHLLLFLSFSI